MEACGFVGPSELGTGTGRGSVSGETSERDGVVAQDFATPSSGPQDGEIDTQNEESNFPLLQSRVDTLPNPASLLHYPIPSVPFQTVSEKFDASIQLLLTQLALSEKYEGAERANERWPDVFSFFSRNCPSSSPSGDLSRREFLDYSGRSDLYLPDFVSVLRFVCRRILRAHLSSPRDRHNSLVPPRPEDRGRRSSQSIVTRASTSTAVDEQHQH